MPYWVLSQKQQLQHSNCQTNCIRIRKCVNGERHVICQPTQTSATSMARHDHNFLAGASPMWPFCGCGRQGKRNPGWTIILDLGCGVKTIWSSDKTWYVTITTKSWSLLSISESQDLPIPSEEPLAVLHPHTWHKNSIWGGRISHFLPRSGLCCVSPLGKYLSIIIKTLDNISYNILMHPNRNKEKSGAKRSPDQHESVSQSMTIHRMAIPDIENEISKKQTQSFHFRVRRKHSRKVGYYKV